MAWVVLVISGLLEAVWALALKQSDGFTKPVPVVIFLLSSAVSFAGLAWAMKGLPAGPAYAVWVGVGASVTAIIGMVYFHEGVSLWKLLSLLCIVAGVVGLALTSQNAH